MFHELDAHATCFRLANLACPGGYLVWTASVMGYGILTTCLMRHRISGQTRPWQSRYAHRRVAGDQSRFAVAERRIVFGLWLSGLTRKMLVGGTPARGTRYWRTANSIWVGRTPLFKKR